MLNTFKHYDLNDLLTNVTDQALTNYHAKLTHHPDDQVLTTVLQALIDRYPNLQQLHNQVKNKVAYYKQTNGYLDLTKAIHERPELNIYRIDHLLVDDLIKFYRNNLGLCYYNVVPTLLATDSQRSFDDLISQPYATDVPNLYIQMPDLAANPAERDQLLNYYLLGGFKGENKTYQAITEE